MGVWLQSRSQVFTIRDGDTHDHPMLGVGPDEPTYFARRSRAQHEHDRDVFVVDRPAPGADYKAPTFADLKAARVARREALAKERIERKEAERAAKEAATKAAAAANDDGDEEEDAGESSDDAPPAPEVEGKGKPKKPKKSKAEVRRAQAALDQEAERGEREVV